MNPRDLIIAGLVAWILWPRPQDDIDVVIGDVDQYGCPEGYTFIDDGSRFGMCLRDPWIT